MVLSPKQRDCLTQLREKNGSAYSMRVGLNTLEALSRMGFVDGFGSGHMATPRTAQWRITDAGKAAIFKLPETVAKTVRVDAS